jgi:hypothetical protein
MAVSEPAKNAPPPEPMPEPSSLSDDKGEIEEVAPPNEMRAFVMADADALTDLVMSNFMTN